jgi:hypothetical protein
VNPKRSELLCGIRIFRGARPGGVEAARKILRSLGLS